VSLIPRGDRRGLLQKRLRVRRWLLFYGINNGCGVQINTHYSPQLSLSRRKSLSTSPRVLGWWPRWVCRSRIAAMTSRYDGSSEDRSGSTTNRTRSGGRGSASSKVTVRELAILPVTRSRSTGCSYRWEARLPQCADIFAYVLDVLAVGPHPESVVIDRDAR
jgi:hypothetical protein